MTLQADRKRVFDLPRYRDRLRVFRDRVDAGEVLALMLTDYRGKTAKVMAIPSGGMPVAAVVARRLRLRLEVAVVSKITPPESSEIGVGAVAFDGTTRFNEELLANLGLAGEQLQQAAEETMEKVRRRLSKFYGRHPLPELAQQTLIIVDDGLASGFTMRLAIEAMRKAGAKEIILAVPTAHCGTVQRLADSVEAIYCPNIRNSWHFAVADAYRRWFDVGEDRAVEIFRSFCRSNAA